MVAVVVALSSAAGSLAALAATPAPSAKMPISLRYSGSFDEQLVQQSVSTAYREHFAWDFRWSGTWGRLIPNKTYYSSNVTPWTHRTRSGFTRVAFRQRPDGPILRCTLPFADDPRYPPTFSISYDTSAGTLQANVTVSSGTIVIAGANRMNPGCGFLGVVPPPSAYAAFGYWSAIMSLESGGVGRYDVTRTWRDVFAGARRRFSAALHAKVVVSLNR